MSDPVLRPSVPRRLRQRLGPYIDRAARAVGQPTTHVYPPGYVATVHLPIADLEARLQGVGFSWDPLSLYHHTPEGSSTDGSWAYRSSTFADRQLHVVLFAQDEGRTDVYAHEEYNWARHPVKHAEEVGIRRDDAAERVRRWLDATDLPYDRDSYVRRKLRHMVHDLREGEGRLTIP